MFSPVSLNLDHSSGRKLLFDSKYDLRTSVYYGADGTDLTESPRLRSLYQKAIGEQNLELKLNKLADDPKIQASIAQMQADLKAGKRDIEPMKAYYHNKVIRKLFLKAEKIAWRKMMELPEVQSLQQAERERKLKYRTSLRKTGSIENILAIPK